jgi:hypothetical protein
MANIARSMGGPIPGQSLTRAPGASPWEKPPQYVDPDDAMDFLFKQTTEPKHAHKLLALIAAGGTLSEIVGTILMSGFMEGKWTPDVATLLVKPYTHLLIQLCNMYEVEYDTGEEEEEFDPAFLQLANSDIDKEEKLSMKKSVMEAEAAVPELGGLMGPRGIK